MDRACADVHSSFIETSLWSRSDSCRTWRSRSSSLYQNDSLRRSQSFPRKWFDTLCMLSRKPSKRSWEAPIAAWLPLELESPVQSLTLTYPTCISTHRCAREISIKPRWNWTLKHLPQRSVSMIRADGQELQWAMKVHLPCRVERNWMVAFLFSSSHARLIKCLCPGSIGETVLKLVLCSSLTSRYLLARNKNDSSLECSASSSRCLAPRNQKELLIQLQDNYPYFSL